MGLTYDPHDPQNLIDGVPFALLARIRRDEPICPLRAAPSTCPGAPTSRWS